MMSPVSLKGLEKGGPPVVVLGDLALIRPLAMAGIPVIVATTDPGDEVLRSRHVRGGCIVPGFDEPNAGSSAEILLELGHELHRGLGRKVPLVYGSDHHLDLLYAYRRELSEHYLFVLNDEDLALALHDKERFYQVAAAAGIRVPKTRRPDLDLEAGIAELREPILVKPKRKSDWNAIRRDLFGGKGKARTFATRSELLAHPAIRRYQDELIFQEQIDSATGDLGSFHGFADDSGRLLASFCGRKIRTWPRFGGESSFIELTTDPSVQAVGRATAEKLVLKGPFKIDLVKDARSGEQYVLEINARFNLWHYLGAVHGVNLPLVAYEYLTSGRIAAPAAPIEPRYRWLDLYRDYHAYRELAARGEASLFQWLRSIASPRNVYNVFAWSDPLPLGAWLHGFIRRRASRRGGAERPLREPESPGRLAAPGAAKRRHT
jgi:D-aspartate ligase